MNVILMEATRYGKHRSLMVSNKWENQVEGSTTTKYPNQVRFKIKTEVNSSIFTVNLIIQNGIKMLGARILESTLFIW